MHHLLLRGMKMIGAINLKLNRVQLLSCILYEIHFGFCTQQRNVWNICVRLFRDDVTCVVE